MTMLLPRLRRAPLADPEPAPAAVVPAGESPAPVPAGDAPVPRAGLAAGMAHGFRQARRALEQREGHWISDGLAGHVPSVNDQRAYLANRGWLPPGHEGGSADRIGEAYQVAVGIPGVALGLAIVWLVRHQFRFTWALIAGPVVLFGALLMLRVTTRAAAVAAFGPALAVIAWVGLVAGLLALRRWMASQRNPKEN